MRRDYLILLTALAVLLLFAHSNSTRADWGGSYATTTTSTIATGDLGDTVSVSSTTTFSGGSAFMGTVDYYTLSDPLLRGPSSVYQVQAVNDPVIEFTADQDTQLQAVRIPIDSITNIRALTSSVVWSIYEDGSLKTRGDLDRFEIQDMLSDQILTLVLDSFQSSNSAFSLSSTSIYRLTFTDSANLIYNFKTGSSSTVIMKEGTTLLGSSPKLLIYSGTKLGSTSVMNGEASYSLTLSSTTKYVISYYSDSTGNFAPSHDFKATSITNSAVHTITASDRTVEKGKSVEFSATLKENGVVKSGVVLSYYIDLGYEQLLGSSTTDVSGISRLSLVINQVPATYPMIIRAFVNNQQVTTTLTLTVTMPAASFNAVTAEGNYGSYDGTQTNVSVTGLVQSPNYSAISGIAVELRDQYNLIDQGVTDATGFFNLFVVDNFGIGSHSGLYFLHYPDSQYDISDTPITIDISKTVVNLTIENNVLQDYGLTPYISGSVQNSLGQDISRSILVEYYTITWQTFRTYDVIGNFNVSLPPLAAGQYPIRVSTAETSIYLPQVSTSTLIINQVAGTLESTTNHVDVPYHGDLVVDFGTRLNGTPFQDGVVISAQIQRADRTGYSSLTSFRDIGEVFELNYTLPESYAVTPYLNYELIITATHENITFTDLHLTFAVVETDLDLRISVAEPVIGVNTEIIVTGTDAAGVPMIDGETISLEIGGTSYSATTSGGQAVFHHTFTNKGLQSIIATHNSADDFPYAPATITLNQYINKGAYLISFADVSVAQGERHLFTASITDHLGIPADVLALLNIEQGEWITLGSATSSSGNWQLEVEITQGLGDYNLQLVIPESTLYNRSVSSMVMTVDRIQTKLTSTLPDYEFNADTMARTGEVILTTMYGNPIAGKSVSIQVEEYTLSGVTDSQGKVNIELPRFLSPGTHTVQISYASGTTYLGSSLSTEIAVSGMPTVIEWDVLPVDVFYGKNLQFSLFVREQNGQYLENMNVSVEINGVHIDQRMTNASGYVSFNLLMKYDVENLQLSVIVESRLGWESTTSDTSIIQTIRTLDLSTTTNPNLGYGETLTIDLHSYSDYDTSVSYVTIDYYLYAARSEEWFYWGTAMTDDTGQINLQPGFSQINAGQQYTIRFDLSHPSYPDSSVEMSFSVVAANLEVSLVSTPSFYLTETGIVVQTLDGHANPVQGLEVTLSFLDQIQLFGTTNSSGQVTFAVLPDTVQDYDFAIYISDTNGNYKEQSLTYTLPVQKVDPEIIYQIIDNQGTAQLLIELHSPSGQFLSGNIDLNINGISTPYAIETGLNVDLQVDQGLNIIITAEGSSTLNEQVVEFTILQDNVQITLDQSQIYNGAATQLTGSLSSGEILLDNYELDFYSEDANAQNYLGTTRSVNGSYSFVLDYTGILGPQEIFIIFPQQAWYMQAELDTQITVVRQDLSIDYSVDAFVTNHIANLSLGLTGYNNSVIEQAIISLVISRDGTIYYELNDFNFVGDDIHIPVDFQIGQYELGISITESDTFTASSLRETISVSQQSRIEVDMIQTIYYGDYNVVEFQLVDDISGSAISGMKLKVYDCGLFCSDSDPVIFSGITNSTGLLWFVVPNTYIPGTYSMMVKFDSADTFASSSAKFDLVVQPEQLSWEIEVIDYGITHNITIQMDMVDETGPIPGTIYYTYKNTEYNISYSGDTINLVFTEVIGNLPVYFDFEPEHNYYSFDQYSTAIGWKQLENVDLEVPEQINYGDSFNVNVTANEVPLTNITLYLDMGEESIPLQVINGKMSMTMLFPVGNYSMNFSLRQSIYLKNVISITAEVEVRTGDQPFGLSADDIHYSQDPVIVITDQFAQGDLSAYYLTVSSVDGTELATGLYSQQAIDAINWDLDTYSIRITRVHPYLLNHTETTSFTVTPIPVRLDVKEKDGVIIFRIANQEVPADLEFTLLVMLYNTSVSYDYLLVNSWSFSHNMTESSSYYVEYRITGYYTGANRTTVELQGVDITPDVIPIQDAPVQEYTAPNLDTIITLGVVIALIAAPVYRKVKK